MYDDQPEDFMPEFDPEEGGEEAGAPDSSKGAYPAPDEPSSADEMERIVRVYFPREPEGELSSQEGSPSSDDMPDITRKLDVVLQPLPQTPPHGTPAAGGTSTPSQEPEPAEEDDTFVFEPGTLGPSYTTQVGDSSVLPSPAVQDGIMRSSEPPGPRSRSGRAPQEGPRVGLILGVGALIAVILCVALAGVAIATDNVPPMIAELLTPLPAIAPVTPTGLVLDLPTVVNGAGGLVIEPTNTPLPTPTETPAAYVTLLPTLTPTPAATDTPVPPTPMPIPPTRTATPVVPTLSPSVAVQGGGIALNGVQMVRMPGGSYPMGSTISPDESPVHTVTISGFYIDRYEVSNAQWAACVAAGACAPPTSTTLDGHAYFGSSAYNNYPVVYINWTMASDYCTWRGARLPTEAEWEMAARWDSDGSAARVYPWGDGWEPTNLNYCDRSCKSTGHDASADDTYATTAPVNAFPGGVSPIGAFNMAGNVAEWVSDWYSAGYYAVSPATNPLGPAAGTERVARGGAWGISSQVLMRSARRAHFAPAASGSGVGVRCAISESVVSSP